MDRNDTQLIPTQRAGRSMPVISASNPTRVASRVLTPTGNLTHTTLGPACQATRRHCMPSQQHVRRRHPLTFILRLTMRHGHIPSPTRSPRRSSALGLGPCARAVHSRCQTFSLLCNTWGQRYATTPSWQPQIKLRGLSTPEC